MREMKFKCWDKKRNKWLDNLSWNTTPANAFETDYGKYSEIELTNDEFFEWVFYTGLKDKNGKEIYEGCVVRSNAGGVGVVEFKYGAFWWQGSPLCVDTEDIIESGIYKVSETKKWAEVIGNIYENPELLK